MATETTMKQGDTAPPLRITCMDGTIPVDLTSATSIKLRAKSRNNTLAIDQTVTGDADGQIVYNWAEGDTDQVGMLSAEVEVTWPGGKKQSFPAEGFITIRIVEDLIQTD